MLINDTDQPLARVNYVVRGTSSCECDHILASRSVHGERAVRSLAQEIPVINADALSHHEADLRQFSLWFIANVLVIKLLVRVVRVPVNTSMLFASTLRGDLSDMSPHAKVIIGLRYPRAEGVLRSGFLDRWDRGEIRLDARQDGRRGDVTDHGA